VGRAGARVVVALVVVVREVVVVRWVRVVVRAAAATSRGRIACGSS
jgi:hypothetical protein